MKNPAVKNLVLALGVLYAAVTLGIMVLYFYG